MHQYNNKKWLTIAYESLLTNFRDEINRINERFSFSLENLNIDSKKPSKSTRPGSIISLQNDEQLSSWKSNLTKKQIAIILKVLDQLDIDIYSEQLEPDYNSLYSISQNV